MIRMPHLSRLSWDFMDRLTSTSQQVVNNATPETTYYIYDLAGDRVRKITKRYDAAGEAPTALKERNYIGSFELYRQYAGDGTTISLERESLNLTSGHERLALIETRIVVDDNSPQRIIRYQYTNNVGSATLELDQDAQVL